MKSIANKKNLKILSENFCCRRLLNIYISVCRIKISRRKILIRWSYKHSFERKSIGRSTFQCNTAPIKALTSGSELRQTLRDRDPTVTDRQMPENQCQHFTDSFLFMPTAAALKK